MNQEIDHLIPMDFKNAVQVPDSHIWVDNSPINSSSTHESVPLIDLDDPQAVEKIKMACETWGIFQVTNHGVPEALFAEIVHQARRFFDLTREQKLLTLKTPENRTGYGIVGISRNFNSLMWMEGFTMSGTPLEHARRVWPQDYSSFCSVIDDYQEQMKGVAEKITSLMFKSLGLSREDVEWFKLKSTQAFLHFNSYPICPDPDRAMGLAPHTDTSLLTLLYQSGTTKGLQVYRPDHNWVDVDPIPDAIAVNVGDLMEIVSNGQFKSLLHRAVPSKSYHRISIPYSYGPNRDVKIGPSLKLIKAGDSPVYRSISWKEYLEIKDLHFFKSLEMVRVNSVAEETNAPASGNEAPVGSEVEEAIEA